MLGGVGVRDTHFGKAIKVATNVRMRAMLISENQVRSSLLIIDISPWVDVHVESQRNF